MSVNPEQKLKGNFVLRLGQFMLISVTHVAGIEIEGVMTDQ